MVTWLVILSIVVLILLACMVGLLFRANHQDVVIQRLSMAMLQFKQRKEADDK